MELFKPRYVKRLSTHSGQLERWLGAEKIDYISKQFMHGGGPNVPWYGPPVNLSDVPGSVWIGGDGDFVGDLGRGFFASAADSMADHIKRLWYAAGSPIYINEAQFAAGFSGISDAIEKMRTGYQQKAVFIKTGSAGTTGACGPLMAAGVQPAAMGAPGSAPAGTVNGNTDIAALILNNPGSGTLHLLGADVSSSQLNNCIMLYDNIFTVNKTMNSTATESVTGVPTRYQSLTASDPDYIGGNFLFIRIATVLPGAGHNWTVCQYTDQDGTTNNNFPSITGISAGTNRFDMPVSTWFCPLATGDVGVKALTQMQCSALLSSGSISFHLGHPIGVMMFPQISDVIPFDWLTVRDMAPRIFNDAALMFFELPKQSATATNYRGYIVMGNAV